MSMWRRFFLFGVQETAQRSVGVFKAILALKESVEREIMPQFHTRRQQNALILMQNLYQHPVVNIKQVREILNVQTNTASSLVNDFTEHGILREMTGHKRNRLFILLNDEWLYAMLQSIAKELYGLDIQGLFLLTIS